MILLRVVVICVCLICEENAGKAKHLEDRITFSVLELLFY